jgi:exodeoxyribonuclease-5
MTLHKLLYQAYPKKNGGFYLKPKDFLEYRVVVVDEVSMVPSKMLKILFSHNVYVLALGDPMQLPMLDKDQEHGLLDNPHVFLDEVMRQAKESEIIQLSMLIRKGAPLQSFKGKDAMVLSRKDLNTGMLTWADQIICATNKTRHNINKQMREILGYEKPLEDGERVVIKRNYWDIFNEDEDVIVNGSTGIIRNPFESYFRLAPLVKNSIDPVPIFIGSFYPEIGKPFHNLDIDKNFLINEESSIDWNTQIQLTKHKRKTGQDLIPKELTYGYAVTCHVAQGSSWPNILVIEEKFPFDKLEHCRWLYTAVTRSEKKLVLIKGDA